MQNDRFIASLPTVLIIPLTSTLAATRFDCTQLIHPDGQNGLTVPSVALIFQVRALDKRECLYRLGVLDQHTFAQVFATLNQLTA